MVLATARVMSTTSVYGSLRDGVDSTAYRECMVSSARVNVVEASAVNIVRSRYERLLDFRTP